MPAPGTARLIGRIRSVRTPETVAACALAVVIGCGGSGEGTNPAPPPLASVASLTVSTPADTIATGDSVAATVTAHAADGSVLTTPPLAWTSSDTTIARVDGSGLIKALATGTFSVTATTTGSGPAVAGTKQLSAKPMISSVALSRPAGTDTITIDDTLRIAAVARDGVGAVVPTATVAWSVSDTAAASIDASGLLHARSMAPVTVTATVTGPAGAVRGTVKATTTLTVRVAFTHIEAGIEHTCGIARGGSVYCWGEGAWGRLGDGTAYPAWTAIAHPVRVVSAKSFTHIALDEQQDSRSGHTCGVAADGSLLCWGSGSWGMLGDGADGQGLPPHLSAVPIVVGGRSSFVDVAVGAGHSCGLTASGAVFCAGGNGFKQLGVDTTSTVCLEPSAPAYSASCSDTFVQVSGGNTFARIFAAAHTTCGLTSTGEALCWGINVSSVANGAPAEYSMPTTVSSTVSFASLAGGSMHFCGLTSAGVAYCWGWGGWGQLGTGLQQPSAQPARVATALTFTRIAAGGGHTCALATSGDAYCWGTNPQGELGSVTTESCSGQATYSQICATTPTLVPNVPKFVDIAAGDRHSCGLTASGAVYCWGEGDRGQLGNGAAVNSTTAVRVKDTK